MRVMIVMGLVAVITAAWSLFNYRRKPYRASGSTGTISPGKVSAAIITTIAFGVIVIGARMAFGGDLWAGLGCSAVGIVLAFFMSPSLTHLHDLSWTPQEVEGPSRLFGPGLGLGSTSISWSDISDTGSTITNYWFIESVDGRRIYWSYLYPGHGSFAKQLRARCPGLALPHSGN